MDPWDFGLNGSMMGLGSLVPPPQMPQMAAPEMFASGLAAQGIRPNQFMAAPAEAIQAVNPTAGPTQNMWDPTPVGGGGPAAAAGLATSMAPGVPGADSMAKAGTADSDMAKRITEGLRGVRMPTPPTPQTVRTPAAAAPHAPARIQGGQLLAMLQALGVGQKGLPQLGMR